MAVGAKACWVVASDVLPRASRGKTAIRAGEYDPGANHATGQRRRAVGCRGGERSEEGEAVAADWRAARMRIESRDGRRSWSRHRHLEEEEQWWQQQQQQQQQQHQADDG